MKKKMMLLLLIAAAIGLSLTFVACNGTKGPIVKVSLDPATKSIEVYEEFTLTPEVENSTAAVVWTTSAAGIATVEDGLVRGVSAGNATITATVAGKSATCAVTVGAATATPQLTLNSSVISVTEGDFANVSASVTYKGVQVSAGTFTWTSDAEAKATVTANTSDSSKAEISGLAYGSAVITAAATYLDKNLTATVTVTVKEDVVFELNNLEPEGGAYSKTIYLSTPDNAVEKDNADFVDEFTAGITLKKDGTDLPATSITWGTDDAGVATVTDGKIEPKSIGSTVITATYVSAKETYVIDIDVNVKRPTIDLTKTQDAIYLEEYRALSFVVPDDISGAGSVKEVLVGETDIFKSYNAETGTVELKAAETTALEHGEKQLIVNTGEISYMLDIMYCTLAIGNADDLNAFPAAMASDYSGYFVLVDNIDYRTEVADGVFENTHFKTFLTGDQAFSGVFDGQGFYIRGMTIKGYNSGFIRRLGEGGIIRNVAFVEAQMGGNGSWYGLVDTGPMSGDAGQHKDTGADKGSFIAQYNDGLISNVFVSGKIVSDGACWAGDGSTNTLVVSNGSNKGKLENIIVEVTGTPALLNGGDKRENWGAFYQPGGNWFYAVSVTNVYSVGAQGFFGFTELDPYKTNVGYNQLSFKTHADFAGSTTGWDTELWNLSDYSIPVFNSYAELFTGESITITAPAVTELYLGDSLQLNLSADSMNSTVLFAIGTPLSGVSITDDGFIQVSDDAIAGTIKVYAHSAYSGELKSTNEITITIIKRMNIAIGQGELCPTLVYGVDGPNVIDFNPLLAANTKLAAALDGTLVSVSDDRGNTYTLALDDAISAGKISISNAVLTALGSYGHARTLYFIIEDGDDLYRIEIKANVYSLVINTAADLDLMADMMPTDLNGYYVLGANIDYRTEVGDGVFENTHFKTFLTGDVAFNGTFDGQGFYIRGMTIKGYDSGFIRRLGENGVVKNVAFVEAQMGGNGSWDVLVNGKVMDGTAGVHKDTGADKGGYVVQHNAGLVSNVFVSGKIMSDGVMWYEGGGINTLLVSTGGRVEQCMVELTAKPAIENKNVEDRRWGTYNIIDHGEKIREVFGLGGRVMINTGGWTETEWAQWNGTYSYTALSQSTDTLNAGADDFAYFVSSVAAWNTDIWSLDYSIPVFKSYIGLFAGTEFTVKTPDETTVYTGDKLQFELTESCLYSTIFALKEAVTGVSITSGGLLSVGAAANDSTVKVYAYLVYDNEIVSTNEITITVVKRTIVEIGKEDLFPSLEYGSDGLNVIDFSALTADNADLAAALEGTLVKLSDADGNDVAVAAGDSIAAGKVSLTNATLSAFGASDEAGKAMLIYTEKDSYTYIIKVNMIVYSLIINTAADLDLMADMMPTDLNGYYLLGANIDYRTEVADGVFENTHFKTFLTGDVAFNGIFDGQGFYIRGMTIKGYDSGFIRRVGENGVVKNVAFIEAQFGGNGSWDVLVNGKVMDGTAGVHKDTGADKGGYVVQHNAGLVSNVFVSGKIMSDGVTWYEGGGINTLLVSAGGRVEQCMVELTAGPAIENGIRRWGTFNIIGHGEKIREVFGLGGRVMINTGGWTETEWAQWNGTYSYTALSQSTDTLNAGADDFAYFVSSVAAWNTDIWSLDYSIPVFKSYVGLFEGAEFTVKTPAETTVYTGDRLQFELTESHPYTTKFALKEAVTGVSITSDGVLSVGAAANDSTVKVYAYLVYDNEVVSTNEITITVVKRTIVEIEKEDLFPSLEYGRDGLNVIDFSALTLDNVDLAAALEGTLVKLSDADGNDVAVAAGDSIAAGKVSLTNATLLAFGASDEAGKTMFIYTEKDGYTYIIKVNVAVYSMIIKTAADLDLMADMMLTDLNGYYVLGANIDYRTGVADGVFENTHFKTFLTGNVAFNGTFDGQGFYIRGMTVKGYDSGFIRRLGENGVIKNVAFVEAQFGGNGSWKVLVDGGVISVEAGTHKDTGADKGSFIAQYNDGLISNVFVSGKILSDGAGWLGDGSTNTLVVSNGSNTGKLENIIVEVTGTPAVVNDGENKENWGAFYQPGGNWFYAVSVTNVYSVGAQGFFGFTASDPYLTSVGYNELSFETHADFAGSTTGWNTDIWNITTNIPVFNSFYDSLTDTEKEVYDKA